MADRTVPRYDVFISYANADRPWAQRLDDDLRSAGFLVFRDERLSGGVEWAPALQAALDESKHLLALWSNHARESTFVQRELATFAARVKERGEGRLIQVNLEGSNPAYSAWYAIDLLSRAGVYPGEPARVDPQLWREVTDRVISALADAPTASGFPAVNSDDFGIVIGIARYPGFTDAVGAVDNARAVAGWLVDPAGGGLPEENVALLVTNEGATDRASVRPTREDIDRAFMSLVERARRASGSALGRRLYLYMSGHGIVGPSAERGLVMANASRDILGQSIAARVYADAFRASGGFAEVVLFVDCDRLEPDRLEPGGFAPAPPPWRLPRATAEVAANFCYYFAPDVQGQDTSPPAGEFTRALLEGLGGRAAGPDGTITSDTLRTYLSDRLLQAGAHQSPVVESGGTGAIVFNQTLASRRSGQGTPAASGPDGVAAHADDPALVDELGRRPFAEVLAARIEEVWRVNQAKATKAADAGEGEPARDGAFMVNLHGPWGAGKTSVLNFLRANLTDRTREPEQRWVVVDFNAWRHQRLQPPWWNLIREIHAQSATQIGPARAQAVRARWLLWRVRADWLPVAAAAALLVLAGLLAITSIKMFPPGTAKPAESDAIAKTVELGLKIIAAVVVTGAALVTLSRSLAFGSARAAQAYMDARSDPLGPIITLFQSLVKALGQPLIVFVDDLDRCEVAYVVALLEGIQTLFRAAVVTYVVAADRKWICSCFEKTYADFAAAIGEPGRPLGYLFLDKVFQVSASVPQLSRDIQRSYWKALLRAGGSTDPASVDRTQKVAESRAMEVVKDLHTQEQLEAKITEVSHDPVQEQAMRAAAAKQITGTEAQRQTEHRLQRFAELLEPNPRSMKRLVNAYGFHQATHFLEGRSVAPEVLARWTIVELRWPLLADYLAGQPRRVADAAGGIPPTDGGVPRNLRALFGAEDVKAVLSGLDERSIRTIVGLDASGVTASARAPMALGVPGTP